MELQDLIDPLNTCAPTINEVAGKNGFNEDHLITWAAKLYLSENEGTDLPDIGKFRDFLWEPVPIVEVDRFEHAYTLLCICGIDTVQKLLGRELDIADDNIHITIQGITRDIVLDYLETTYDLVVEKIKEIISARAAQ